MMVKNLKKNLPKSQLKKPLLPKNLLNLKKRYPHLNQENGITKFKIFKKNQKCWKVLLIKLIVLVVLLVLIKNYAELLKLEIKNY